MLLNNRKLIFSMLAGALMAGTIGFIIAYTLHTNSLTGSTSTVMNVSSSVGSKQNPHVVALKRDQTEAIDLLINKGDHVQFNSKDGSEHQIIQGKPTAKHGHDAYADAVHGDEHHGTASSPLDSGAFAADEGYLVQFKTTGKYEFHDNYNHEYAITVIVYDKYENLKDTKIE